MTSPDDEDNTICKETGALYARENMLRSKSGHHSQDGQNLFMAYCSPLYCCSLWTAFDNTITLRSIHVAQNDVFRFMFHLPWFTSV